MSQTWENVAAPPETVEPPRVSRRTAVLAVFLGLTFAGALVGAAWAWLAPPIGAIIGLTRSGERVRGYVGDEANNLFLGAFLLPGLVTVVAVIAAVLVWRWRAHRGPAMVGALALGTMAATGAAAGVGAALARLRYGFTETAAAPVSPEHRVHYVTEASAVFFGHSPLQIATTIVFPAGVAALVYALCVLATMRDDLGAWPPMEPGARLPVMAEVPVADAALIIDQVPKAADGPPVGPSAPSH